MITIKKFLLIFKNLFLIAGILLAAYFIFRGYRLNSNIIFYPPLILISLFLLLLTYTTFLKKSFFACTVTNTIILLIFLIFLEFGLKSVPGLKTGNELKMAYSFQEARGDPEAFRNWWWHYVREWRNVQDHLQMRDPDNILPFVLRPNSSVTFFSCLVKINSYGFRDKEFNIDKGANYRIVAIGESTTMGETIKKDDLPWPNVLENLIKERWPGDKPIEVINAGVQSYNLENNIHRLVKDVLSLKPDMVISYHGYNCFRPFIIEEIPALRARRIPFLAQRPSYLLARLEVAVRSKLFKIKYRKPISSDLHMDTLKEKSLDTTMYKLYKKLISLAKDNNFDLVLLNYNMAVNEKSPAEAVNFYAGGFPDVRVRIVANVLHTYILEQISRQENVLYIDISSGLDGNYAEDMYIDLVHFTQKGRNRLAENISHGISNFLLEKIKTKN